MADITVNDPVEVINIAKRLAGVTIKGTKPAGSLVLFDGLPTVGGASATTWSIKLTSAQIDAIFGQGPIANTLPLDITDKNNVATSTTLDLSIDTVAPGKPTVDIVATDDIINRAERGTDADANSHVTLTGTREAGSTVKVNGIAAILPNDPADTTWSLTLTKAQIKKFGEGNETLKIVATDENGNTSITNKVIAVDTVAPVAAKVDKIAGDNVINIAERDVGVTITGSNEAGSSMTVNGLATMATSAKTWSVTLTPEQIDALGEGNKTLTVVSTDAAGNQTATTKGVGFKVDLTPPAEATINTVAGDDDISAADRKAGVTITGAKEAGSTVTLNGWKTTASADGLTWSIKLTVAQLNTFSQGDNTLSLVSKDAAGNTTASSHTIGVHTGGASFSDVIAGDNIINIEERDAGVAVSGIKDAGSTVKLNGLATIADSDTTWHVDLTPAQINKLGQGLKTLTAVETLNGVSFTSTKAVIIDTLAPKVSVNKIAGDNAINIAEHDAGLTITGTKEAGSTVTFQGFETTATSATSWRVALTPDQIDSLPSESDDAGNTYLTLSAAATDAVGNSREITLPKVFLYTSEPTISIDSVDDILDINDNPTGAVLVTGSKDPGTRVTLNGLATTTVRDEEGLVVGWKIALSKAQLWSFAQGTTSATLTAVVKDTHGNSSTDTTSYDVSTSGATFDAVFAEDNVINAAERDAGVDITGQVPAGTSITSLKIGGKALGSVVLGEFDPTWSYTLDASTIDSLGQGIKTLSIVSTFEEVDANDVTRIRTVTANKTVNIDTLAPAAVATLNVADNVGLLQGALENNSHSDDNQLDLSGTIVGNLGAGEFVAVYDGDTQLGLATVSGNSWAYVPGPDNAIQLSDGDVVNYNVRIEDAAGNQTASATKTVTIDNTAPTVEIAVTESGDDGVLLVGETALVQFTFSEAMADFSNADLTFSGGDLTNVASDDGGLTWTATFTPAADTESADNLISLNNGGVWDLAGNVVGAGTTDSSAFNIDTKAPAALGIALADDTVTAGDSVEVTFTFSEAVTGFTNANLGFAHGTLTDVAMVDDGTTWNATFTPDAGLEEDTNVITLNDNTGITDLAGNPLGSGVVTSDNLVIDTIIPTATISIGDTALKIGDTSLVTINFSEAVTGFSNLNLTVGGGELATVESNDGGMTWSATFTPTADLESNGNLISLDMSAVEDLAGNAGAGSVDSNGYDIDTLAPSATAAIDSVVDDVGAVTGPLTSGSSTDDTNLDLSGAITGALGVGDVVAVYDGTTRLGTAVVNASTWTYTDNARTLNDGDAVDYSVLVEDAAGNLGAPSATFAVTIDLVGII